ncbi:MAG: hypothetical protein H7098_11010, partial [Oligoflexus sp.]|nr:hypothetical protein [Pseudopedobacter sp.]
TRRYAQKIAFDKESKPVFLASSAWDIEYAAKEYPAITFHDTSEWEMLADKK